MEESILLKHLIESEFLCIEESEIKTKYTDKLKNEINSLKQILNEKQYKAVKHYCFDLTNHLFEIRDKECFKMFYLGIKLGMEVSDFCHKEVEKEVLSEN